MVKIKKKDNLIIIVHKKRNLKIALSSDIAAAFSSLKTTLTELNVHFTIAMIKRLTFVRIILHYTYILRTDIIPDNYL